MKLHILSDLHLEFAARHTPYVPAATEAEVVILAGDIHNGTRGIDWAEQMFPRQMVLYIPGNHEYYDGEWAPVLEALKQRASITANVHVLDNDELIFGGVRFLGATLWTDFELLGHANTRSAMASARTRVVDFRAIRVDSERPLTPEQTVIWHRAAVTFLKRRLAQPYGGKTVVVTHHAPHPNSIHARWAGDVVNAAFVSDLSHLMSRAVLWVHGHTHDSFDYTVNATRIVANPQGYPLSRRNASLQTPIRYENSRFDPRCVVSIQACRS